MSLNPLSYVVLALVGRGGASSHDLVEMMRRGARPYWAGAASKIYAEPKRLAGLGYLATRVEPGKTRAKTVYTLTALGEQAVRDWAVRPSEFPRIQHEAVVRLVAGDIIGNDLDLCASLTALRAELEEIESELDRGREAARSLPHRERYLRLVDDLGRRMLVAHREWLDEVERDLRGAPPP
jgi:DNA-binding PadR family transcriptional regulator